MKSINNPFESVNMQVSQEISVKISTVPFNSLKDDEVSLINFNKINSIL
mgnify:CR=1 FL=1